MTPEALEATAVSIVVVGGAIGTMGAAFSLIFCIEWIGKALHNSKKPRRWYGDIVIAILIFTLLHLLGVELLELFVKP